MGGSDTVFGVGTMGHREGPQGRRPTPATASQRGGTDALNDPPSGEDTGDVHDAGTSRGVRVCHSDVWWRNALAPIVVRQRSRMTA
jgi:hypothetical protein